MHTYKSLPVAMNHHTRCKPTHAHTAHTHYTMITLV